MRLKSVITAKENSPLSISNKNWQLFFNKTLRRRQCDYTKTVKDIYSLGRLICQTIGSDFPTAWPIMCPLFSHIETGAGNTERHFWKYFSGGLLS